MLGLLDKNLLIKLHLQGLSNTAIANELKISRPTVIKYVKQYQLDQDMLEEAETIEEKEAIIIKSSEKPKYNAVNRKRFKVTPEVESLIESCLQENKIKIQNGQRKLIMKKVDIHEFIQSKGYDISYRTVCHFIAQRDLKAKETYIKQDYAPGESVEFDWGEVTLNIKELGGEHRMKIGVFTFKHSDYRWAALYTNENTESFLDIHTKFFEDIQGAPQEVVYDNALVNVQRLAGKEKKPTPAVSQLCSYYGYQPRYTNYYSGNEKGNVERAVELVRRKAYCTKQCFDTIADAELALSEALNKINEKSKQRTGKNAITVLAEEKKFLSPVRIPMDASQMVTCTVNKYSFIYVDTNFYSVPDYLSEKKVIVRKYPQYLLVYYDNKFLFKTKRMIGRQQYQIDINHYLKTLKKKPGAIAHSLALKQATPWLQEIFHQYYNTTPREYIDFLELIKEYSLNTVQIAVKQLELQRLPINTSYLKHQLLTLEQRLTEVTPKKTDQSIQEECQKQLLEISSIYNQGDSTWIN